MWENKPLFLTRSSWFMGAWLIFILDSLGAKTFENFPQSEKESFFNSTKIYLFLADSVDTGICDCEKVSLIIKSFRDREKVRLLGQKWMLMG